MKFKYPVSMSTVAVTLLFVSPLSAAVQDTLGSAADFVVLAGTVTSVAVPIHLSNGDVGGTTVTGGPTVDAGFEIITAISDGNNQLPPANADLITAQNNLRALELSNPVTNLSGQTLSGMVLDAGIYKFDVAASFTNGTTLKLDAGGLNGGVWVFNIGTELTTAALAGVEIINLGTNLGADIEIYWNAGTAITIGANNTIIGNYLAGTSISVGTTDAANDTAFTSGRALAQAGVSFDGTATFNAAGPVYLSYVELSPDAAYAQGASDVVLIPGTKYQTGEATIDGDSSGATASMTVFRAIATLTGTNNFGGGIVIEGGTLIASTDNLPVDAPISMISDATFKAKLVFDQPADGTFGGVISGDGSLTKQNDGMLTLTGENTYVGTTTVAGGTLAIDGAGTLGNIGNALVVDSGTLDLGGTEQTVGAVNLSNDGQINNGTLTGTSYASTGGSVDAVLAGVGVVFTNTSGTTTLTGANTYSGGTVISGGSLVVNTASLPADEISVAAASNLVFDQATDGSFDGVISGDGSLVKENAGNLTLTDANTFTGGTTINGGSLTASVASLPSNGAVALANDSGLILDQGTDASFGGVVSGDGSFTKDNVGALTLTGANTYTGGTNINGGSLIASTATLPSAGDVALANDSSLILDQATAGTLSGDITGAGSLTKNNVGALTLSGENTYSGGTTINGGTLIANSSSLPLDGAVVLANNSGLVLDQASDGSFGGVISGDGSFTKDNAGSLTLTGTNTYTGGTTVTAGRLVASTTILPINQDVALADNSTLVLNETANGSFGGVISGPGTIEKQGAGVLTLANDTDAALDLRAGSFLLTDNTIGSTTLAAGSFLRGNGTISGNLFNAGTVSPGNSPGVIVVAGNFTQTPAGTLVMEIASAVSFDQLLVAGTADLDGTLQLDVINGFVPTDEDFTIITAGGGVNGEFNAVTGSAALTADVAYNANDVTISFTQAAFNTFAGTPNQIAVANAAQQSPALTTALNGVPLASQMPAALNALSPQGYQVWSDIAFAHTASLGERLRHQPHAVEGEDDIYFEGSQSRGYLHGDLDVNSSRYTSESGLVGVNHAVSPSLTLGGFFEYTETNSGMGSSGSRTEVETKMPGIRAAWKQGAWFANAVVGYGLDDYESTREINFPGTSATAKSKTKGSHWLMDVSGGRRFLAGPVSFSPFAGLQASSWKTDGFSESGAGALNADVESQSARSLRTQLGLEVAVDFTIGSALVRPHVRGAWIHELENDHRSIDASFGAIDYSVETRDPQRDSARLSAGFDVAFSRAVTLYADYSIQTGHTSRVLGEWRAGLSIGF